jgi:ABC-type branched-subunit amino acid transport system substrate-binding protein
VDAGSGANGRLRVGACMSLSGRFSRFGRQAARALEVWASLDGEAEVLIEDDASDVCRLRAALPGVAARSDLLSGPYSTMLMRAAGDMAAEAGWLVWNHGGSGDDVETAHPGHVVSVLTPTSRYAEPFLSHLAACAGPMPELRTRPPRLTCAVAAGVREFGEAVQNPDGTFGIAQWFPGSGQPSLLGPNEPEFLDAYHAAAGESPGYPAAQAAATAVLAVHCARQTGNADRESLWPTATALDTTTLFGAFKIDQASGAQTSHRTVLIRWADKEPIAIRTQAKAPQQTTLKAG